MSRTDDLAVWRIFCEVARSGGVHAACETLNCEPSTVSRALKAIEAEIGAPLFRRDGRNIRLTELGRRAQVKANELLDAHQTMLQDLRGDRNALSGTIRLAAHAGISSIEITPCLIEFRKVYPDITLELHDLSRLIPDIFLTPDGPQIDMTVGYGPDRPIEGLVSRHLGEMPFICCASPLYIRQHGKPHHPSECIEHTGILVNSPTRVATKELSRDGMSVPLHWKNSMTFKNLMAVRSAAALGAGIVPDLPLFHAVEALKSGQLVPVMNGWRCKSASCFIFATEEAYEKRRVRVLMDWLTEHERRSLAKLREDFPEFYG